MAFDGISYDFSHDILVNPSKQDMKMSWTYPNLLHILKKKAY